MFGGFYRDKMCSVLAQSVEEVKARIATDEGHKPGKYFIRECEFIQRPSSLTEQLLVFKPGSIVMDKTLKGVKRGAAVLEN